MRKNKLMNRLVSICLVAVMLLSMCGCSNSEEVVVKIEPMEIEEAASYSWDIIGGKDVMPIMGFFGPSVANVSYDGNKLPDWYSDDMWQLIQETGINMINYSLTRYNLYPEYGKKMLEQGEKYDIGIIVMDDRLKEKDLTLEEADAYINEYSNYPSFAGVHLIDEPGTPYFRTEVAATQMADFKEIAAKLNDLNIPMYGGLFGMDLSKGISDETVEIYDRYVKEWIQTVNPKYILYDRYIFDDNCGTKNAALYFKNMEIVRSNAEEANIPFMLHVEAGQQWNDNMEYFDSNGYYPSQGEFYWNVGTLLAFGAKGISYFPLIQPLWFAYAESEPFDFQRNGLIGAWGNKTRWFYYAQDMNKQIAAIDEVLMNAVNKGIIASGNSANKDLSDCKYLMEGTAWRELTGVTGDAMIGCFNYKGKTALYVVNYDTEYAQNIRLDFADKYNITITQNAETERVSCHNLELTFKAGGSALIVFE